MSDFNTIPYKPINFSQEQSIKQSEDFYSLMSRRRSIRDFSDELIPEIVIENILKTAGSAPSGANKQPWFFCAVKSSELKNKIRVLAEKEEVINYGSRMSESWKKDLEHLGTNEVKEFLDIAPWLIIVMKKSYEISESGEKLKNYYPSESVGIASGLLIAAIHNAGLVTLTHTPSPMDFLREVLERPINEKPYLLLPVGLPNDSARIPDIQRKEVKEIIKYYR